jgi:hypothetical protein
MQKTTNQSLSTLADSESLHELNQRLSVPFY